ncbi:restriction endonuclease subunit S [Helicobacter pylori]|nr:restriction endonuclease subunit S [Helicobacter pylori]
MDALMLPLNWQRVRLGDMTTSFTKQTGFDYSASIKPTLIKEQLPNYIPFIQNKDFSGHYINYKTDYFIPNEIAIRFPQILLNEKCLLISIVGSIGNVAVFNHSQDAFTGCAIAVLKFKEKKSLDFVMHFLMSASGQKSLLNIVKASSHKSIILADLRDLLIPLPPLNEQSAIANILSALDRYLCVLDALILKKEGVKKALSFELLSQRKRLKGFNQAWQKVRLGDIFFITAGGDLSKPHYSNTKQSDFNYPIYSNAIEKKGLCGYSSFFIIKNKSITITARGTIGVAFFRDYPYVPIGRLLVLQPKISNIDCRFYAEYINSKVKFNTEQTTIPQLTIPKVALCEIPLPPLNEQSAIANVLSTLDNEITSLKNKKRQFENIKKALNHDLMSAKIRVLEK